MRWSMLPVSFAAHAAALVICLVVPIGDLEAPTPWPASSIPRFVAAVAVPMQVPDGPMRRASLKTGRAPTTPPDTLGPGALDSSTAAPIDGGLDDAPGVTTGAPSGLAFDTVPPPVLQVPAPARPTVVRPGGAIREPRKVVNVPAVYPELARAVRAQGVVIVEATIDERGVVTDAKILRSVPLLDGAALAALKQWRYTPTLLNGVPVRVLMTVTFHFSLGDREL